MSLFQAVTREASVRVSADAHPTRVQIPRACRDRTEASGPRRCAGGRRGGSGSRGSGSRASEGRGLAVRVGFRGFGDWGGYRAGGWGVWAAGRRRHCGWCWAAGRGLEASAPGRTETSGASRAGCAAGTDGAVVGARGDVGTWGRTARSWGRPRSRGAQVPCSAGACGRCWDPRGPECRDGATAGWGRLRAGPFTGGCFLAPPGLYLSGTFPFRSIFKRRCLPQAASLDVFGCEPRSGPVEGLGPYG